MSKELIERLDARFVQAKSDITDIYSHEYAELRRLAVIGQQCLDAGGDYAYGRRNEVAD